MTMKMMYRCDEDENDIMSMKLMMIIMKMRIKMIINKRWWRQWGWWRQEGWCDESDDENEDDSDENDGGKMMKIMMIPYKEKD